MTKADIRAGEPDTAAKKIPGEAAPASAEVWLQRVGVLSCLPRVLADLGVDAAPVLAAAGLPATALARSDERIPFESAARVLHEASRQAKCPHIGVLVGGLFRLELLGMLGELVANSPTVGDALRAYAIHQRLYSQGFVPYLLRWGERAQFGAAVYRPTSVELSTAHDTLLAAAVTLIRELLGSDWAPAEAHLPHARPRDTKPYVDHFQCRVRFDSDQAMLVFAAPDLRRRVVGASPARLRALEAQVSTAMDSELLPLLHRSLRVLLLRGDATAAAVAQGLAMHERTLARRLQAQGTSFRAVLDEVRYEAARQLLLESNLKITSIAAALGYADGATFCRAFKRWSGTGPREWRADARRALQA